MMGVAGNLLGVPGRGACDSFMELHVEKLVWEHYRHPQDLTAAETWHRELADMKTAGS